MTSLLLFTVSFQSTGEQVIVVFTLFMIFLYLTMRPQCGTWQTNNGDYITRATM